MSWTAGIISDWPLLLFMYSTRVVSSDDEFQALESAWNELLVKATDANTFLSFAWLHSWWTAYRPAAQLRIVLAERDGRLCGIAPLMRLREHGVGRILRRLRFIGDGTFETDHMNFVVDADDRAGVLSALLDGIDGLSWDIAHFNQMPESSANTAQLLEYAKLKNWSVTSSSIPCPRRVLPRSYDELLRSLPSRLRTAVRSARRDLESRHMVEFGMCTSQGDLPTALETLYANHGGRWQAKGEQGVFVSEKKREFYAALSSKLLEEGSLRFFFLKLDGRVVAQQFCFEHTGTVMLLQEGFDFEFSKQNVGNVLRAMVFERLIADGVNVYDFLAGTTRHKQSWSDGTMNDLILRVCRPSLLGRAAFHLPHWVERAKQLLTSTGGA